MTHTNFWTRRTTGLLLLAIGLLPGATLWGQQSYRTRQAFSGKSTELCNNTRTQPTQAARKPAPQFRGLNYARKFQPDFLKYFQARTSRIGLPPLFSGQKNSLNAFDSSSPLPAILPGLEFRPASPAGSLPTSVVTGDFNRDGHLDYIAANGGSNDLYIYFGNGDGTFQLPVVIPLLGTSPVALVATDMRGIGILDLAVVFADTQTLGVLLGNGDGTFGPESDFAFPSADIPTTLAAGDFNGDGNMDLVVGLDGLTMISFDDFIVFLGDGTGHFPTTKVTTDTQNPDGCEFVTWLSAGDVNKDGKLDLLVSNGNSDTNTEVWIGNGDGTFQYGERLLKGAPYADQDLLAAELGDVNQDGCLDAVVTDTLGVVHLLPGNCDGTFQIPAFPADLFLTGDWTVALKLVDLNGDGHLDIVTSGTFYIDGYGPSAGDHISVLLGDGTGNFGPNHAYRGDPDMVMLALADFNGDGFPDVVTANQSDDTTNVFLNDGQGGFGDPQGMAVGPTYPAVNAAMSGFLPADLNGDGKVDLAMLEGPAANGTTNRFTTLMNDGTGKLLPARSYSTGVTYVGGGLGDFVLADFRKTGHPDLLDVYGSSPASFTFMPNNGDGTFGAPAVTQHPGLGNFPTVGVGDFNGDGILDFVVAGTLQDGSYQQTLSIFLGNGDGTFRAGATIPYAGSTPQFTTAVFVGDFNRDGKPDILVWLTYNQVGSLSPLYEFTGKGDGTFNPPQLLFASLNPFTVVDVNNDGWPDLIEEVTSPADGDSEYLTFNIYLGQANGTFQLTNSYQPYQGALFLGVVYPVAADFNGDGNIDVAVTGNAFPAAAELETWFLMGNGDGSFTPTYDAYPLNKLYLPSQFLGVDLRGNGMADLLELDDYGTSYDVVRAGPASSLQLSLNANPVAGSTGSATVNLNLPPTSAAAVTLSSSDPNIVLPGTVQIPAGTISQSFNFTLGPGFNSQRVFSLTATLGSDSATAYGVSALSHATATAAASLSTSAIVFPGTEAGGTGSNETLTVTSTGSAPLIVSDFYFTNSSQNDVFSAESNCAVPLSSGESCTIDISLVNQYPGPVTATLIILDNSPTGYESVSLTGSSPGIANPINTASTLFLPQAVGTTSSPQSVVIKNTAWSPLAISSISVSGAEFAQTNDCPGSLPGTASCTISLTFSPTQPGAASGNLTIVANFIGSPYVIPISGYGLGPAPSFSPTLVQFSSQFVSTTSAPGPVTMTNTGGSTMALSGISTTGDFAQTNNCPASIAVGGSCTINVTFKPTATGTRQGSVLVADNGVNSPQSMNVTGYGMDFSPAISTGSSSSATVSPGAAATYPITVGWSGGAVSATVSFTCTGLPSEATCVVTPNPMTLSATTNPGTITVSTTAPSAGAPRQTPPGPPQSSLRQRLLLLALALGAFAWAITLRKRVGLNRWQSALGMLAVGLALALALAGCGGGGGGGGGGGAPSNPGTPAGTYTVTVTGTANTAAGSATHNLTLTLIVN